jgi:hypothetical protein
MGREHFEHPQIETSMANFESGLSPITAEDNARLTSSRNADPAEPLSGDHGDELTKLLGGIPTGFVNRSEGFVEFLATPSSVSNALVGIGPMLDNAVNYYGNHLLNGTTHQIANDAATACKSISGEIGRTCQLPADKRGELIGGIWVDVLLAEAGGLIVKDAVRANALTEQVTERSIPSYRRKFAGAGGDWPVIKERISADVVQQIEKQSCVSAVGEMLSEGRLKQSDLIAKLGAPTDMCELAAELGPEWNGKRLTPNSLNALLGRGSFAAELLEEYPANGYARRGAAHTVVVDGVDDFGSLMIRDPMHGTRYEMLRSEFEKIWTGGAVWRK